MAKYDVGVNLQQGQVSGAIVGISTGISALMGNFERGPLQKATLVTSFAQFQRIFGAKPATNASSWYSVQAFFKKVGAGQLYVVRVASSTAAKATVTLQDRQGTPANTLKVEAKSEGSWGNGLAVKILDDSILATTLAANVSSGATSAVLTSVGGLEVGSDIELDNGTQQEQVRITQIDAANKTVYWTGGLTNAYSSADDVKSLEFKIEVYDRSKLIETLTGLSMNDAVTFFCETKVDSDYITVTDLKTTDTGYTDLPAVTASAQALSAGADGLTDVIGTDYEGSAANKTGVYALDAVSDLFRFCCPDPLLSDADTEAALKSLYQAALDYANTRQTVMFYADVPYSKTVAEAVTFAASFEGQRIAMFWPWLNTGNESVPVWIPPSAAVMGTAVDKDARRGVHKSIGNEQLAGVAGLEYPISVGEHRTLDDGKINGIRAFAGRGTLVYNDSTLSASADMQALGVAEQWAFIGRSLELALTDSVFEPHNPQTWKSTVRRIRNFLNEQVRRGAITPTAAVPEGFVIKMDDDNNPQSEIAQGIANIEIGYVPTGRMKYIVITLTADSTGATITS